MVFIEHRAEKKTEREIPESCKIIFIFFFQNLQKVILDI